MTWFAVDDSFHGHPKLAELEQGKHFAAAVALWTLAGSWCAYHLTNGVVPAAQLRKLVPFATSAAAAELVRVGLWSAVIGGYQFKDWVDYQPTREEVELRRDKSAARTRKSRNRAKLKETHTTRNVVTPHVTNDVTNALVTLSRPDPSHTSTSVDVPRPTDTSPVIVEPTPPPTAAEHAPTERMLRSFDSERHPEIIALVSETRQGAGGAPFVCRSHTDRDSVSRLAEWAGRPEIGATAAGVALRAFWAAKGTSARLSWLVEEDPGRFLGKQSAKVRKGEHRPALPNDCYSTDLTDLDRALGGGR